MINRQNNFKQEAELICSECHHAISALGGTFDSVVECLVETIEHFMNRLSSCSTKHKVINSAELRYRSKLLNQLINFLFREYQVTSSTKYIMVLSPASKMLSAAVPVVIIDCISRCAGSKYKNSIAKSEYFKRKQRYSLYLIVSETCSIVKDIDPKLTAIDQIYVLRKDKKLNSENPLSVDLVIDLFNYVVGSLTIDKNPIHKRINSGRMIDRLNRPLAINW